MAALDVWLYHRRAGRLEQSAGTLSFSYTRDYARAGGVPLSQSLPVRAEPYGHAEAHSFFSNLLPEGPVRRLVASRVGVSAENDFGLLAAIGGDCAGAVSLLEPRAVPEAEPAGEVRWLDEPELERALAELPRRPLLADPDEGIRLSLAGAQDKLPVVVVGERIGIPLGGTPSTHIVKTPIEEFDDTVANEAFCLRLASELGLDAARVVVRRAGEREFLLVERYDRTRDGRVERLHQEDFCQALGIPPELKYESEGGPGLTACFDLVRRAASAPARDVLALLDGVTLDFLIGNHDAHAKNLSLLYDRGGVRVAPLYDLVCTSAYPGLSRKLAMSIGGEYRAGYVRRRHVDRFAQAAGLGPAAVRRRMLGLARRAPSAVGGLAGALDASARPAVIERIQATVGERAEQLQRELG